jgi:hypothetical protein
MSLVHRHPLPFVLAPVAGLFAYALAGGDVAAAARLGLGLLTLGAVLAPLGLLLTAGALRLLCPRPR